jgi:alkylated DNA repair dioxygenase AlkB
MTLDAPALSAVPGLLVHAGALDARHAAHAASVVESWLERHGRKFAHRSLVARYGYDYAAKPIWIRDIPFFFARMADSLGVLANSVSLAKYEPRDDISPHVDLPCWDHIAILNLGNPCEILFEHAGQRGPVLMQPGDLLQLTGESLRDWKHSIFADRLRYSIVFRYRSDP